MKRWEQRATYVYLSGKFKNAIAWLILIYNNFQPIKQVKKNLSSPFWLFRDLKSK